MLLDQKTIAFLTRISAKLLYGTIILMTVLGSLRYSPTKNQTIVVTVFFSLLAVALADTYAYFINEDMRNRRVSPWRHKWSVFRERSWVMGSILVPITLFVLAAMGILTQEAAFRLTEITLALVLLLFGFITRRVTGGSIFQAFLIGAMAALLGLIVAELNLWAKYLPAIGY